MRHEFVNNTTMTLNIKREKNLPITAAVFQRGQVLLSKKAGKGFSVKKKKIMTLAIDILDQIFCVIQERNSGVPRDSLWEERRWGEGEEVPAKHWCDSRSR